MIQFLNCIKLCELDNKNYQVNVRKRMIKCFIKEKIKQHKYNKRLILIMVLKRIFSIQVLERI